MSTAAPPQAADRALLAQWRAQLDTRFAEVDDVFDACASEAATRLSAEGMQAYLAQARWLGKLGRGVEPMLIFLATWPQASQHIGEGALAHWRTLMQHLYRSPNGQDIAAVLQCLATVAPRLGSTEATERFTQALWHMAEQTMVSIHGRQRTHPSVALPALLGFTPQALSLVSVGGWCRWVAQGLRLHPDHPDHQRAYFSGASPESKAALQRERRGVLLVDVQRPLSLTLQALWQDDSLLVSMPSGGDAGTPSPYWAEDGVRLPDVYPSLRGVSGLTRYRMALAHVMGHRQWSQPLVADNWSPMQRMAVEVFEDARVDRLLLRRFPGLRATLLALHPTPKVQDCYAATQSCWRHRLARWSRAALDADYADTEDADDIRWALPAFHEALAAGASSTRDMASLALAFVARTRRAGDSLPDVVFTDTVVSYRDDNRHLWTFIEEGDEEDTAPDQQDAAADELQHLPPRHYPEWDHAAQSLRPDWVSLYEHLQAPGRAADIDAILEEHADVAKHMQRVLDALKPQDRQRLRHQPEGTELDLDLALRAIVDWRSGAQPDERVHQSHTTQGRDLAVLLLLDLSESLNQAAPGRDDSILRISQAAVALLAWAVDQLGDAFAIAGFQSNTRHDVRYVHIKGFGESFDDVVKARLGGVEAMWSTRMGAALRHAGQYLSARRADKKLLLVLTDGEPADVDVQDPDHLIEDSAQAVRELDVQGVHTHCISLDARADDYVARIFGHHATVVDHVADLPHKLPEVFISLTGRR